MASHLIEYAISLGASRAKFIDICSISIEDEVVTRGCGTCPEYGKNFSCPPHIPSPSHFRRSISGYNAALLFQIITPLPPDNPEDYRQAFSGGSRLHDIVLKLEDKAIQGGAREAAGFISGCCRLCPKCPISSGVCRFPHLKRSSMEANGANVLKTCAANGWELSFPVKEKVYWTGLLLINYKSLEIILSK